jgi:hypothetical protein
MAHDGRVTDPHSVTSVAAVEKPQLMVNVVALPVCPERAAYRVYVPAPTRCRVPAQPGCELSPDQVTETRTG